MKEFGTIDPNITYNLREGSYGIALEGDSVLIEKARLGYFLPGGGIEVGETPEEALKREFVEETGYTLKSSHFLGSTVEYKEELKKISHFYIVELGSKGTPTYEDGHIFPVEWVPFSEIENRIHLAAQWWAITEARNRK